MNRPTMFVVTALAATFFCPPGSKALAQQASPSRVALLCKTSLGGSGFAIVTLSNLTTACPIIAFGISGPTPDIGWKIRSTFLPAVGDMTVCD